MTISFGAISQRELCYDYGVPIKTTLATKYAGLKITFPADLDKLGIGDLVSNNTWNFTSFSNVADEDAENLATMGITNEKIKQIAHLANYYAEKHYLRRQIDNNLESSLEGLRKDGIQFTVCASTSDRDQSRNLAFNHDWQQHSNRW